MELDFSKEIKANSATEFEEKILQFVGEWFSDSKTVSVQTSGSTGKPKIFEIEKDRMCHSARMTCDILGLKKGDSALLCLPIEYISGKMMVVRAIERQFKLIVKTPSSNPLQNFNEDVDFCAMSPLQVENSLHQLHLIRNLIIGGAAVSEPLKNKIRENLKSQIVPSRIYETYGMSETLSHIALKEIFPLADDYFKVVDDVEISLDERGCLQIFAPKLNPEILITNDVVEIKNNNEFKFIGRLDYVINSGGLKIQPEELEKLVKNEIQNEVVFVGIKDDFLGQKLVLVVETLEDASLKEKLEKTVYPTKNHRPKEIIFLENFPRFPNGKVDRSALLNLLR